jgi:hypothetical protein
MREEVDVEEEVEEEKEEEEEEEKESAEEEDFTNNVSTTFVSSLLTFTSLKSQFLSYRKT